MMKSLNQEATRKLEEIFGDRLKTTREPAPTSRGTVASVMPRNVEEMRRLSEVAQRNAIPLVPLGAGTATETIQQTAEQEGGLLVRFDLMRRSQLPEAETPWIEAEPGVSWLELENALRTRGHGLAVYPTSAPRATVGGWLATDGLGVGSFEYGWLSDNVFSANVVLPGGKLREVSGGTLQSLVGPGGTGALFVSAKLRTRKAYTDTPFAISFDTAGALIGAVTGSVEAGIPLWHLAFLNPAMARSRRFEESYLVFGAYPGERADEVDSGIRRMAEDHGGSILPTGAAHRVWTERFFPVAPAHPTPDAGRIFVPISQLPEVLSDQQARENVALQGTVARSKEMLILTLYANT